MERDRSIRVHRIGTVTFGAMLIIFGVLFLAHIFLPWLYYGYIIRLWPLIFIFLGMEVLAGNYKAAKTEKEEGGEKIRFVYDKTAIVLLVFLTLFAFVMAMADLSMQHSSWYCYW